MGFIAVCTALYDYSPQADGELPIKEGELVYILEKNTEDDWWKAKKRAENEEGGEPFGLIPNNYVEDARPLHQARALYDYSRQTDEEISFSEDASLAVYDTSDPDWTLVGFNGEFGFAPANYIEISEAVEEESSPALPARPLQPAVEEEEEETVVEEVAATSPVHTPAANLASIIHQQATGATSARARTRHVQFTPEPSEDEGPPPSLPQRPVSQQVDDPLAREPSPPSLPSPPPTQITPPSPDRSGVLSSPPENRISRSRSDADGGLPSAGGYHLYNVNEMVSVMGKQKKMPTTLGINLATGVIMIIPEKKRDGPQQEWTADKLTHYSIEGKHVFLELVKPSKSIDFHAGAKDTAQEIVSSLGELAGMARAEGLREVIAAGTGQRQKKGHMLYEFMAQGDDEVTVAEGDEVIVLDDQRSEEWWKVRRLKNGKEGVVPSSYVEITTEVVIPPPSSMSGINAGKSTVEQNRVEEERLAREALQASREREEKDDRIAAEVGPGLKLPNRGSSLVGKPDNSASLPQRGKRESRSEGKSSKTKPDISKIRTWTDRTGSFKVDAQFIGLKDGKIHLHKLNGVKIAVPVAKMAVEDLEYVERVAGVSLDDDKPVSEIIRRTQKDSGSQDRKASEKPGARLQNVPKKPEYDWFDFFLKCGVSPYQCERYSYNFNKDSMDQGVLEDITPEVLRKLGLKEGDILRVMKYLDNKYGRTGNKSKLRNVSFGGEQVIDDQGREDGAAPAGGLFSGPGGTLKNNTRKGRPAPPVQTNDVVDSKALRQKSPRFELDKDRPESPEAPPKPPEKDKKPGAFDDDAWDIKPTKQTSQPSQPPSATSPAASAAASAPPPAKPVLKGAMKELSLLDEPLQPVVTHTGAIQQPAQSQPQQSQTSTPAPAQPQLPQTQLQQPQIQMQPQQQQAQNPQGATPALFSQLNQQATGLPQQPSGFAQQQMQNQSMSQAMPQQLQNQPIPQAIPQQTGQFQINAAPRQRPQAPQMPQQQGSIMPPPPARPLSAPQNASQQSSFGPPPLQPQLTGVANTGFQNQNSMTSPTQTLNDLQRMRLQQQMSPPQQQQPQFTGFQPNQLYGMEPNGQLQQPQMQQGLQPQMTGAPQGPFFMGQQTGSPFADPRGPQQQPLQAPITGFQPNTNQFSPPFYNPLQSQPTGSIKSVLSPPLQPQNTAMNGMNGIGFGQQQQQQQQAPPPVPQIPQQFSPPPIPQQPQQPQQMLAPLQPQKTGPAPHIKFGIGGEAKKLAAQPTGRRANLSQATPDNPFGF